MKRYLHKKLGLFDCRFKPYHLMEMKEGEEISCDWCKCYWKMIGGDYDSLDSKLVKL